MNEDGFVRDIKQSLDEGLEQLDAGTRAHLHAGRRRAMAKTTSSNGPIGVLALAGQHPWFVAAALASGLLLAAWSGLHPNSDSTSEDAQVDIMLLTGNIPPQAYADWSLVRHEDVVGEQCVLVR